MFNWCDAKKMLTGSAAKGKIQVPCAERVVSSLCRRGVDRFACTFVLARQPSTTRILESV
jgi:hypothetical protein